MIRNDPRWYAKWFFRRNRRRVLRYEETEYSSLAGVVCITREDQEVTRLYHPTTKTITIPQGVDCEYYRPAGSAGSPDLLLFSGTAAVRNLEAMKWFVRDIVPLIHRHRPTVRLRWIGNVSRERHAFLQEPWIETTGFVTDTPPYFNGGSIYVAPFSMGEGMKTKIVEALAMGKVVVATTVAMRGIDLKDAPFVRIEDTARGFARAVVDYSRRHDLASLGALAREYAVRNYSWETVLAPLAGFIDECVALGSRWNLAGAIRFSGDCEGREQARQVA
jgi:glycosyltransferase involved in cell wall biosynthesis